MKIKRLVLLAAALAALTLIAAFLFGCGNETPGELTTDDSATAPEATETDAEPVRIQYAGGDEQYTIIRPDGAADDIVDAGLTLKNAIKSKTGAELDLKTDLIAPKAGYEDRPCEIVVGETTRPETAEISGKLGYSDWAVAAVNKKIVIVGGSDKATITAINYFISKCLTSDGVWGGEDHFFAAEYPVESITINGTDVSEFALVYPTKNSTGYRTAANYLWERVALLTGIRMKYVSSATAQSAHEITVGDVGRGPAQGAEYSTVEIVTAVSDAGIGLASDYIFISGAVTGFTDKYLPAGSRGKIEINLPAGVTREQVKLSETLTEGADLRVMTSNILADSSLSERAPLIISTYTTLLPDVIGMQEVNATGHSAVISPLSRIYTAVGTKLPGSGGSCYTPILYRTELFTEIESGCELFSSRWPQTNTKSYAWVVLERKSDGKRFAFLNAHWALILGTYDTVGVLGKKMTNAVEGAEWREDNSRVILERLATLRQKYGESLTAFICGDMNASPSAKSVTMLETGGMKNAISIAKVKQTGLASFHSDPGTPPGSGNPIDIFVVTTGSVSVLRHRIFNTDLGIDMSDHCPVYIDVKLN